MNDTRRSWTRTGLAGLALAALLLPWNGVEGQQPSGEYRLEGRRVAVYNLAGQLDIVRGSGPDVVVRVTRGGGDADRLDVAVDEIGGRTALRVIYPDDEIVYDEMGRGSRTTRTVRSDGTFSGGRGRGDRVTVKGSGSGLEAHADLRIEVPAGHSIEAYVAVGRAEARDIEGDVLIDTGSGSVDVSGITGNLSVDTGSGRVTVREVEGEVEIDTGSGSVTLDEVRGERVYVDTGSGGVEGADITARSVHVDTGSGSIDLMRVASPDLYLDTGSGSVEVELLQDVERLDIDTGSGSVTVYVPESLGAEIQVETGSGGIDVDLPVELRIMRRDHIEGTIGDGRGRIRIDTGSGGVDLIRR